MSALIPVSAHRFKAHKICEHQRAKLIQVNRDTANGPDNFLKVCSLWFPAAMIQEGKRNLISDEPIERQTVGQAGRSALSWREKLLLTSMLLVVAGWIIFRLLLTFFAPH